MRLLPKKSALFAGALLMLAGGTARASDLSVLEVTVPFAFVVDGRSLPAGQYMVRRDTDTPSVLMIQGEKDNHAFAYVETIPAGGDDPAGQVPALSFTRRENQYRLSSIWESKSEGESVIGR